jgi:hypothetical protein
MSLKIEQILDGYTFTESKPEIFTNGVKLVPLLLNHNNKIRYVWVVNEFVDESFDSTGKTINPIVYSDSIKSLVINK